MYDLLTLQLEPNVLPHSDVERGFESVEDESMTTMRLDPFQDYGDILNLSCEDFLSVEDFDWGDLDNIFESV
jgi:hypothetical protein